MGRYGRLGHGDEVNQYSPKLVAHLLNKPIVEVALGERHSAALTGLVFFLATLLGWPLFLFKLNQSWAGRRPESGDLFTWGDGNFGVLGQEGEPQLQTIPKIVDYLARILRKKVARVACGAYHTLCTTGMLPSSLTQTTENEHHSVAFL